MMVPASRLLWWTALVVVPGAAVASLGPAPMAAAALITLGLVAVAATDAAVSLARLDRVKVDLPDVTRLAKNQDGAVPLQVTSPGRPMSDLLIGLPFPPEIATTQEQMLVSVPQADKPYRASWPCTPLRRGRYPLDACYLGCPSLLGFWQVRRRLPAQAELRVYPDLRTERRRVAAMFLSRGALGVQMRRQVGKGREFEKLRDYQPGDSFEDIHWKATARRRKPVTKLFRVERTQEVYVLLDTSRLSARKSISFAGEATPAQEPPTLLERCITSSLVLGQAAEQQGDLFGLVTFNRRVQTCLKARRGTAHINACRDLLYTLEPELVSPDYGELCSLVRVRLRKRALLVVLTHLDDPVLAESFVESARLVCRQHLMVVVMMKPPGADPLFSLPAPEDVDGVYRHLAGHLTWRRLREVQRELSRMGIRLVQADDAALTARLISEYMSVKQKQLL
jgi:uncharacterized protein (DUF58 family)